MTEYSDVQIIYDDDVDITNHAVIAGATFSSNANAMPGECEIVLRDLDRELDFVAGRRLKLLVDGIPLWSGFNLINGRTSFFPAGDGRENTKARRWVIRGADNNRLLDFRVLRRPANYLKHIPFITTNTFDGEILRDALENYFDMPSWLDISSNIDDVVIPASSVSGDITAEDPWAYPAQGSRLRVLCDDLAQFSAAVFYIGPDDSVHYHAIRDVESPWGFSDKPNRAPIVGGGGFEGAYWGFRELIADEDGSELATDALVWGGSEWAGSGGTVFGRATDATLEAVHNKWQLAETHFGETNFKTATGVQQRANLIVFGNPDGTAGGAEPGSVAGEGPRGLRYSQWSYGFAWHTLNVPMLSGVPAHLYPGDLVSIQLWSYSKDGGVTPFTKLLPLRALKVSFPGGATDGKAIVRFDGSFDLRNQDPKFLWSYLRRRERSVTSTDLAVVDDSSTDAPYGALGRFTLTPDGVETVFTVPFGYIPGTTQVYVNGLILIPGTDYTESNPDAGEITFATAPDGADTVYVITRTLAG